MKQENKKGSGRIPFSRLVIALLAVSLSAVLILWDQGWIDLPFLPHRERTEGLATETDEGVHDPTREVIYFDRDGYAATCLSALYQYPLLADGKQKITKEDFEYTEMSLVKTRLPSKEYKTMMGYLQDPDGTYYRSYDLARIPNSQNFALTYYRDKNGNAIFQDKESRIYHVLNDETLLFEPILFHSGSRCESFPMPASYGIGEEDRELVFENGLFGYKGSYQDGWRKKTFTVPAEYTTAFPYAEGFAVMADAEGRVTIRNEKGEVVLSELSLILPKKEGYDALGFHYFDHGLLRVCIASYHEDGSIAEARETVIDTEGNEYSFPEGYRPASYYNGVFTLTDGISYGYFDAKGEWITSPVYSRAAPFLEGIAVVVNEDGYFGLIDRKGEIILPCAFEHISAFSEGVSILKTFDGKHYLLCKVDGIYRPEGIESPIPPSSSFYTKVTITRGPQNTFREEEVITLILPQVSVTTTRKPLPEFWE